MIVKIVTTLCVLLIVLQTSSASLTVPVIVHYKPILRKLGSSLATVAKNEAQNITLTSKFIESVCDTAQENVNRQINNLQQLVEEENAKANASGKDISSCVISNNQQIGTIKLDAIDQCRTPKYVTDLRKKVSDIKDLKVCLVLDTDGCIVKHPISGGKLKDCFEGLIEETNNKSNLIEQEINSTLDQAIRSLDFCVQNTLGRLDLTIDDAQRSFEDCV